MSDRFSSTLSELLDHVRTTDIDRWSQLLTQKLILRVEVVLKVHFLGGIFAHSTLFLVAIAFA